MTAHAPIRQVGDATAHHFFGYYNKTNFDRSGRRLLAQRVDRCTGDLTGREVAIAGYFDLGDGDRFHAIGQTTAWNWQMGSQLQWVGQGNRVLYNARSEVPVAGAPYPDFCAQLVDLDTGETRRLPLPVYVLAPRGDHALCVNYARFMVTHKTIGYPATGAEPALEPAPADDGIYRMDMASGHYRLILSLARLRSFRPTASMHNAIHWITHLEINPSGRRFLFIHRWTGRVGDETCFLHRLFTMNSDGTGLRLLECSDHPLPQLATDFDPDAAGTFDYEKSEYQISHPMWKSDDEVIVWAPHAGAIHYHLYNDRTGKVDVIGPGILTENGHMTCSRDGRWILSDTYPDADTHRQCLFLFDTVTGVRHNLGSFHTPPDLGKHNRCDLHPRWSHDNRRVCIDSVHTGSRQIHLVDVENWTGRRHGGQPP